MNIGTPYSASATKALLLGAGELGKEIAISLQRHGVQVIAADRYPNAPAMQVAHVSAVLDMTDPEALTRLIREHRPHFVIPEIEAIATGALQALEAAGEAVIVPNAKAIQLTMNREGIRQLAAAELGLPTSKYAFAASYAELLAAVEQQNIGYPCFVKPTMSSSGKGQSMARDAAELQAAWDYAQAGARASTGKVIVEAKIEFDFEITLLTVRALNSKGETETHFCQPIGHRQEAGDYRESWQPQAMSAAAWAESQRIAAAITAALGGLGLFGVELFVKGDQVWFSEVSPRPHDTGLVTLVSQRQSEFDLHVRAILGLPVDAELAKIGASAVILAAAAGENVVYAGLELALEQPESEVRLFGKPQAYPGRRMGVALAGADSVEQARARATAAAAAIKVAPG